MTKITTHTIVKNEENFISYALSSWEPHASKMLVFDDSSEDETKDRIENLNSKKITLKTFKSKARGDITEARNKMLSETKTEWFLILDGDEVWDSETIKKFLNFLSKVPKETWAIGMRTKNAIGDVYHYLGDQAGKYKIKGRSGNLNIRAYKKLSGFSWKGDYPLEYYADANGNSINDQDEHLAFFEGSYFHFTNLKRSSKKRNDFGRAPMKWEKGDEIGESELPEVMRNAKFKKRSKLYEILARAVKPAKNVKRHLVKL